MKTNNSTMQMASPGAITSTLDKVEMVLDFILAVFLWLPKLILSWANVLLGGVVRCWIISMLCGISYNDAGRILYYLDNGGIQLTDQEEYVGQDEVEEVVPFEEENEIAVHPVLLPEFVAKTAPVIEAEIMPMSQKEDELIDMAMNAAISFIYVMFEEDGMDEKGLISVTTPWSKRGDLPGPVKRMVRKILDDGDKSVFFLNISNLWQFNIAMYPTLESATNRIREICKTF